VNSLLTISKAALFSLLIVVASPSNQATAQIAGIQSDGWHTWQTLAVPGAPDICCFSWRSGDISKQRCDLDGRGGGFSSSDDAAGSDQNFQIYVLMKAGVITKIRALGSSCPVSADTSINDLGTVNGN